MSTTASSWAHAPAAYISASGSLSDDHTCVGESSSNHTSIADSGDLGSYTAVSGVTGGYYNLVTSSRAIAAGSSTHCLTRDQRNSASFTRSNSSCNAGAITSVVVPTQTPTPTITPTATATLEPRIIRVLGGCTLAQAITAANTNSRPLGSTCPAGGGPDTIELSGNVRLTAALPDITSSITLDGNGFEVDTDGHVNNDFRMLSISGSRSITVRIQDISIEDFVFNGGSGGALYINNAAAAVTIDRVRFDDNETDGSNDGGALAVAKAKSLLITQSAFSANHSDRLGGALYLAQPATIEYSSFYRNSSSGGGGIYIASGGGGSIIRNSSFIGNNGVGSGAGALESNNAANITVQHVTFQDNYVNNRSTGVGAIKNVGSNALAVNNSLLLDACSGSITASGSLSSDHTCVGESSSNHTSVATDSDLGTYVALSGASGGYYPLSAASVAIGAGSSTHCLTRDQRNDSSKTRSSSDCDVGAIHYDGTRSMTINVDSGCSLPQAVTSANTNATASGSTCEAGGAGIDRIELDTSVTLTGALPDISSDMIIDGNGLHHHRRRQRQRLPHGGNHRRQGYADGHDRHRLQEGQWRRAAYQRRQHGRQGAERHLQRQHRHGRWRRGVCQQRQVPLHQYALSQQ